MSKGELSRGMGRLKGCAVLTAAWLDGAFGGEVELALCLSAISATLHNCKSKRGHVCGVCPYVWPKQHLGTSAVYC